MNKILKNYIYNFLYQIFILLIPLITVPYLARTLGASNIGVYSYINSISNLIVNIGLLGLYDYSVRQIAYFREDKNETSRIFIEIMLLRVIFIFPITFIYFYLATKTGYKILFLYYYPWILANILDSSWFFIGIEKMKVTCLKNFLAKFIGVVAIFLFVKEQRDILKYIYILSLSTFFSNIIIYRQLWKELNLKNRFKIGIKNLLFHLKESLKFFGPQIALLVYTQVDRIMIPIITKDTLGVGFYDQAEKLIQIPMSIITVISTVMMPRLASEYKKGNLEKVNYYLIKTSKYMLMMSFPLMFGILTISEEFVPWYLGREFLPVIKALILLVPIILSNTILGLVGKQYFTAINELKILFFSYILTGVANIVLNIIFILKYNWYGSIFSTLISSYLCVFLQLIELKKRLKLNFLLKYSSRYCIYSFIMWCGIIFIRKNLFEKRISFFYEIIIGIIIYIILLLINKDIYNFKIKERIKFK